MGFLNDLVANKTVQSTTMPSWYDQAQQNVVNRAASSAGQVPGLSQTAAGQAINQVMGENNPFFQAQGSLNQIAAGAANPWLVTDTGEVAPNVATPLGGLFAAQNQQLEQLMPNYTAPVTGQAISSGQFGSLRGQTAYNKAIADAYAQLLPQQMQAALQSQQTGAQAASALGDVGSKGIQSMTALGQAQQADPMLAASALGKIIAGIQTPTTVTQQTELSPLNLVGSLLSGVGGSISGVNRILDSLGVKGGLLGLPSLIIGAFGGGKGGQTAPPKDAKTGEVYTPVPYTKTDLPNGSVQYGLEGGGRLIQHPNGTQVIIDKNGKSTTYDAQGNPWEQTTGEDWDMGGGTPPYFGPEPDLPPDAGLLPGEEIYEGPLADIGGGDYFADTGGGYGGLDFAFNDTSFDEGYNVNDDWFA